MLLAISILFKKECELSNTDSSLSLDFISWYVAILLSIFIKNNNYNKNVEAVFNVRAGTEQDMYNLYCIDNTNNEEIFHNTSLINSYKLSVYMNNLFRTIRENNNLDLIEESENEDDFENLIQDKYVNLNKSYYFVCRYNNRFKKWTPKQIINQQKDKFSVITQKEVYLIEKK